jgi:hypothetical protein
MEQGLSAEWRRRAESTRATSSAFSFALVVMLVAGLAWAQLSPSPIPRTLRLDTLTCQDLESLSGEQRDRLLIYLTGYFDGKQGTATWDELLTGQRIDRVSAACKSKPDASLLRVFNEAWSR